MSSDCGGSRLAAVNSPSSARLNLNEKRATTKAIQSLDSQMTQAFEASEEALMESMMAAGTWGHPEPMRQFETQRLELWASVVDEFLPVTSDLSLVG